MLTDTESQTQQSTYKGPAKASCSCHRCWDDLQWRVVLLPGSRGRAKNMQCDTVRASDSLHSQRCSVKVNFRVLRYPGQSGVGFSKIPTVMFYNSEGQMMCAGAETQLIENVIRLEEEKWIKVLWCVKKISFIIIN